LTVAIDKSLKRANRLQRSRNVLTREERIEKLKFEEKWGEDQGPFGLPKVRVVKTVIGKKKKKKAEEEGETEKPAAAPKKK
jgi:small basic protein (TIGR04137 family)